MSVSHNGPLWHHLVPSVLSPQDPGRLVLLLCLDSTFTEKEVMPESGIVSFPSLQEINFQKSAWLQTPMDDTFKLNVHSVEVLFLKGSMSLCSIL